MRRVLSYLPVLLLALSISCSPSKVSTDTSSAIDKGKVSAPEIRGFRILPEKWINDNSLTVQKNIYTIVEKCAAANYNCIYFSIDGEAEKYLNQVSNSNKKMEQVADPLKSSTDAAHKNGLRIFLLAELPVISEDDSKNLPGIMTDLNNKITAFISKYDIDGIGLILNKNNSELPEYLFSQVMTVKPYLVTSLVYSGETEYQNAVKYLDEGISDLIIPLTGLATETEKPLGNYTTKASLPEDLKKIKPVNAVILDVSDLFPGLSAGQVIYLNGKSKKCITDSHGLIGFMNNSKDTIELETTSGKYRLLTESWSIPFKYSLLRDGKIIRKTPWVELREMPDRLVQKQEADILCKTEYPAVSVRIDNDSLKQYKTGIFFDRIKFHEGSNRVRATVISKDSSKVFYENEFIYHKTDLTRQTYPLWINDKSVSPSEDIELLPQDVIRISFRGSKGQEGSVEIEPGNQQFKCSRQDFSDYSLYTGLLYANKLKAGRKYNIVLNLDPTAGAPDKKEYEMISVNTITIRELRDFPVVKVVKENSRFTYDLSAPRLGGPIRNEFGPGVIMKTNGKFGDNYRVRLSNVEDGYISKSDVQIMPEGTVQPGYYIESISCGPSKDADVLSIPYPEPVPYEVYPDPDQRRLVITLFGVETSSTWMTHLAGRKIISKVTWQQPNPETYQIYVNLNTSNIWGYSLSPEGKRLVLRVKYPPIYDINNVKPLTGLKIAIEAGHGGSSLGAVGLSGLLEKEINLDLSFRLGELCRSMGAEVFQVRDSDKDMAVLDKRDIARKSGANLLVCIHANAGGGGGDYLGTSGTSTYYLNSFWEPLAEKVYERMLELKLKEFGNVGSFNYTVTRNSQMPSILVEQAFLDNADDEEKLADSNFRQMEAQKIYEGIIDYLKSIKDK